MTSRTVPRIQENSSVLLNYVGVLGSIALIWLAACVSPGPDFLLTTRIAATQTRAVASRAALGIALGCGLWGLAGFFGIHALFLASPWLYLALKIGGGAYLAYLGARLLRQCCRPAVASAEAGPAMSSPSAFRVGLLTNLANPKAPLFTSSLFAAVLPQHPPAMLGVAAAGVMLAVAAGWFLLVVHLLTTRRAAAAFASVRRWVDGAAGVAFLGFGARLALER